MFGLGNHAQVKAYFEEWLKNINEEIRKSHPNESIKDYPSIEKAFKKMKTAWKSSFQDQANFKKMEKRDRAIAEIGRSIAASLQRKKRQ